VIAVLVAGSLSLFAMAGGTAYAIQQENHDVFCASCHTEPESQYYQQSLQQNSTTLAAFHAQKSVRCIDCHSGGGPLGRVEGLSQGAQDLSAYYSRHYHTPAITLNKLGDDSCTKCHAQTLSRGGFNNHFHGLLPRWQSVDPNAAHCVDCHTSHPTADPAQGYLTTAQVQMVCQNCHRALGE
jgi:predicted CXXCH cytochrome family protein